MNTLYEVEEKEFIAAAWLVVVTRCSSSDTVKFNSPYNK
jgi:hypothetical protein